MIYMQVRPTVPLAILHFIKYGVGPWGESARLAAEAVELT